jgi:hypothetical protein
MLGCLSCETLFGAQVVYALYNLASLEVNGTQFCVLAFPEFCVFVDTVFSPFQSHFLCNRELEGSKSG